MAASDKMNNSRLANIETSSASRCNITFAIGLVVILATLLIRMPTPLLDMLLACSISLTVAVLMITISSKEPLELSAFPSLLLLVTLFRLALNVASTRLILTQGDAGKIIYAFGDFVAGGSFIVGLVIFVILFVIQFVVVTKGAERISEVSARFTLDAMPGKQMAVDADLNAGAITEAQANERRGKIVKESEFFGAMDGASKFIRGDAKAGIIITAINLIGGIIMGYTRGMTVADAIRTYSVLSIGDGLVCQFPSMIISISSAFLVTKISSSHSVGQDLSRQFLKNSQPLLVTSAIVAAIGFVPGLPAIPFLLLAGGIALTGKMVVKSEKIAANPKSQIAAGNAKEQKQPVEELLDVDKVSVHVGVRLIGMVDPRKDSTIFDRIGALRRRFAQQLGVIMPLIRLKDDISLESNAYEIKIFDHTVSKGKLQPEMFLAMDSGDVHLKVAGIETAEPVYGLPALWIAGTDKETAELSGYTVIDPESVFITHLSEILKKYANELLTREDVQQLVDRLRKTQPSLVGDVVGDLVSIGMLQRVLKNLLAQGIPIRELGIILEALGEYASKTKNTDILTEMVRKHLKRTISSQCKNDKGKIPALTLDPSLEHQMISSLRQEGEVLTMGLPAETAVTISSRIVQAWKAAADRGIERPILLCDSRLRHSLAMMLSRTVSLLPVIAYDEIVPGTEVEPVETVSLQSPEAVSSRQKTLLEV